MEYFTFISLFSLVTLVSLAVRDDMGIKLLYVLFVTATIVFTGLRGVADEYYRIYNLVPPLSLYFSSASTVIVQKGALFTLLCSVVKSLGLPFQTILILFAFTSITLHAVYFQRMTKYYILAFLIYLAHEICLHEWIQIRGGLTCALLFPIMASVVSKKRPQFFFLVMISIFIQFVGFLSVVVYWLNRHIKTRYLLSALVVSVFFALTDGTRFFLERADALGILPKVAAVYLNWEVYGSDIGLTHFKTVQQLFVMLLALYLRHKIPTHPSPFFNIVFNMYCISTISFVLFSDVQIFATRIGGHFYTVEPVLITFLARYFVEKRLYSFFATCGALLLAYVNYVVQVKLLPYYMIVRYQWIERSTY